MQKKLLFLSFIEGAAVMAAELCGAKLLAPLFGSSLYVWASVMGFTLMALAGGYFYGGWISEKKDQGKSLFRILIAASLLIVLMPPFTYYVLPFISLLPFLLAVFIGTVLLIFMPVFLLGAASPLFIALQSTSNPGKVSGVVYAVSTLGGILATFLCGFLMIPGMGLTITLVIFGSLLFLATLIVFRQIKTIETILFLGFVLTNLQFFQKDKNVVWSNDGIMGKLEVQDVLRNGKTLRILKINNIIQTEMDLVSKNSVSEYILLLDKLVMYQRERKKALVLGLGGGLTSHLLLKKNYDVKGVEFDQRIIDAAKNYFFLDPHAETQCEDARYYLNHCKEKYDLVLFDVFKAEEQPEHVITVESMRNLLKNLNRHSAVLINWHGYTGGAEGKGTTILKNTLEKAGYMVTFTSMSNDQAHRNIIILAMPLELNPGLKSAQIPYEIRENYVPFVGLNTDDRPLLEKYNAPANKAWRSSYLRYYQNNK